MAPPVNGLTDKNMSLSNAKKKPSETRRWSQLFWLGVLLSSILVVLAGLWLSRQPAVVYDDAWCDAMLEVPHIDWQEVDFTAFAEHCLNPSSPIPSAPAD